MPVSSEEILGEEDVAPAREKHARTAPPVPPPPRPRRRGLVLMFMIVIIVGGMAIAIVQAVSPSTPAPASARAVPDSRAVEVTPPPPVDPGKAARAAAETALRELVASESPRVRRIAASAFARTGDAASIAALVELLAAETSEITRLDIAYALARAGDARGADALAAGLESSRRDVRADAARLLILLGDANGAGAKELGRFLDNRSQRLGAAEALARIEDKAAMQVLDEIYLDATAPPDDKIRATIALGRARRGAVKDELIGLLGDGRFNAFAAIALADLKDTTGRDVLVKQLSVSSLRVGAALALRRLDPALDAAPLVPALTDAIAADKDVARVTAAEAILILTGPPELANYD
jgi:HEAT repeat protein